MLIALLALAAAASAPIATARVTFDRDHIIATSAHGIADRRTGRALTVDDPVRIASISKLVVALAVMRLVDAGRLSLDDDVSVQLGWALRNPAYPDVPITLRMLLSHQSSLRDDAGYFIPLGSSLRDTLANPAAWDRLHRPGRWFHYTNLNFPAIASVMEVATGERFDRLMARLVFTPLAMDACFNWTTCSDLAVARAAVLYATDGSVRNDELNGQRPACPVAVSGPCALSLWQAGVNGGLFSPQGGMRISARDLARIGQLLIARGAGFLRPASFRAMTRPAWRHNGHNGDSESGFFCGYGLGVQVIGIARPGCNDDPLGDGRGRFGHAGEAYGLRSGLWVDARAKTGIAFFATGVADDTPSGKSAFTGVEEALFRGD